MSSAAHQLHALNYNAHSELCFIISLIHHNWLISLRFQC